MEIRSREIRRAENRDRERERKKNRREQRRKRVKRRVEDIRAIPFVLDRGMFVRVYEVLESCLTSIH
jgi:hypothetical protein